MTTSTAVPATVVAGRSNFHVSLDFHSGQATVTFLDGADSSDPEVVVCSPEQIYKLVFRRAFTAYMLDAMHYLEEHPGRDILASVLIGAFFEGKSSLELLESSFAPDEVLGTSQAGS